MVAPRAQAAAPSSGVLASTSTCVAPISFHHMVKRSAAVMTTSPEGQREIVANGELAVNPEVAPAQHIARWADVKVDPIDVARAGALLPDAVQLMQDVGWK